METTHVPKCEECGVTLVRRSRTGPNPRFTCSPECHRQRKARLRTTQRQEEAAANPRLCSECGAVLQRKWVGDRGGSWPKTCSEECRASRVSKRDAKYAQDVQMGRRNPLGTNSKDGYRRVGAIPEHRIVMAQHLGRPLERWEVVHHKNGKRDDNRIANLEVWVKGQPAGQRVEDIAAFMVENYRGVVEAALNRRE